MYFNKDKSDTNIDNEFNENNILSNFIKVINKYKLFILIAIILIILIIMLFLFLNRKPTNYLALSGEEIITIHQGTEYQEPGYEAYNSKNEDLTDSVNVVSNLDVSKIGEYEIKYTLGDTTKIRKIVVVEKPADITYIYLKTVNNDINVYLKKGEKYIEPGYQVFSSTGNDLTSEVKVIGTVDTSKAGSYKIIYSVVDSDNVTISASRIVIVMDSDINLSLNTKNYTNESVTINIGIVDNYFDYLVLPDNNKVNKNTYSYTVTENGKYTFTVYNTKGISKQSTIEVTNIDKNAPTGSCTIDQNQSGSFINVKAADSSGIKKYIYNNKEYNTSTINLTTFINSAKITIYDNANNSKEISCTVVPKVYINNVSQDGVIVTINAKKVNNDITGYYFSYTSNRPDKNTGGYISTDKENIDVVRLPGTTYIWVEDKSGKISEPKTVTITNDALLITNGNNYKILENTQLSTYLSNAGWSIEELNKLMARSVRAAGLYTKEAAATAAVAFQTVLAQKYKIKLPYWNGGKSWSYGADPTWGKYKYHYAENLGTTYYYYGLDCSGFTTWAYVNAGYNVVDSKYPAYWWGYKSVAFSKDNGEIGDFIINDGHVKLIIGKTPTAFITAEAKGKAYGMVVNTHAYSSPNGYKIQKGEELMNSYNRVNSSEYPTGF